MTQGSGNTFLDSLASFNAEQKIDRQYYDARADKYQADIDKYQKNIGDVNVGIRSAANLEKQNDLVAQFSKDYLSSIRDYTNRMGADNEKRLQVENDWRKDTSNLLKQLAKGVAKQQAPAINNQQPIDNSQINPYIKSGDVNMANIISTNQSGLLERFLGNRSSNSAIINDNNAGGFTADLLSTNQRRDLLPVASSPFRDSNKDYYQSMTGNKPVSGNGSGEASSNMSLSDILSMYAGDSNGNSGQFNMFNQGGSNNYFQGTDVISDMIRGIFK